MQYEIKILLSILSLSIYYHWRRTGSLEIDLKYTYQFNFCHQINNSLLEIVQNIPCIIIIDFNSRYIYIYYFFTCGNSSVNLDNLRTISDQQQVVTAVIKIAWQVLLLPFVSNAIDIHWVTLLYPQDSIKRIDNFSQIENYTKRMITSAP